MAEKHFPKGLDGRMRDKNGEIYKKRGDTQVSTLREEYGQTFAPGYPPEATLGTGTRSRGLGIARSIVKEKGQ